MRKPWIAILILCGFLSQLVCAQTYPNVIGTSSTAPNVVALSTFPLLNVANTWAASQSIGSGFIIATTEFDNGNSGASKTINFNNGNQQKLTLTANTTLTFTAPTAGVTAIRLRIIQGAGGPWTITWPTSGSTPPLTWAGGFKPPTSTAAAIDIAAIQYSTVDSSYQGVASLNFQ